MAHSAEILVNGVLTQVTEFDSTAQQIDNAVANMGAADTPQGALAALGAGVNPNLLVNSNLQLAINQRGQTQYSGTNVYGVDGWYTANGQLDVAQIPGQAFWAVSKLTNTDAAAQRNCFAQRLEYPTQYLGKTLTYTVLFQSGANVRATAYATNVGSFNGDPSSDGLATVTFTFPDSADVTEFRVHWSLDASGSCVPLCAKLEEGDKQTLAWKDYSGHWNRIPQPEDGDYGEELAKCQRYLQVIAAGKGGVYFPVGYGMAFSTTAVRIATYSPVAMRPIVPTVSFSGKFQLVHGSTIFDVTAIKQDALNSLNLISLNAQATGLTLGDLYQLRAGNDATAKIIISAEL